jgi:hypothetical protein
MYRRHIVISSTDKELSREDPQTRNDLPAVRRFDAVRSGCCWPAPAPRRIVRFRRGSELQAHGRPVWREETTEAAVGDPADQHDRNSAYEVASNPELQRVGPARIKDRIAGMTAEEIIDFADRNSTVTLEVKSH